MKNEAEFDARVLELMNKAIAEDPNYKRVMTKVQAGLGREDHDKLVDDVVWAAIYRLMDRGLVALRINVAECL